MAFIKPALTAAVLTAASAAHAGEDSPLQSLDYDGDGTVTVEGAIAARMESFFAADTDQDGALNAAEYEAMMAAARQRFGIPKVEPARGQVDPFTFADSDADGLVTAPEFRRITERLVHSLDEDGDGRIPLDDKGRMKDG